MAFSIELFYAHPEALNDELAKIKGLFLFSFCVLSSAIPTERSLCETMVVLVTCLKLLVKH